MDEDTVKLIERVTRLEEQVKAAEKALELASKNFDVWKEAHNGLIAMLKEKKDTQTGREHTLHGIWAVFISAIAVIISIISVWLH